MGDLAHNPTLLVRVCLPVIDSFIKTRELSHLFRSFGTQEICLILLFMLLQVIIIITVVPINISEQKW